MAVEISYYDVRLCANAGSRNVSGGGLYMECKTPDVLFRGGI